MIQHCLFAALLACAATGRAEDFTVSPTAQPAPTAPTAPRTPRARTARKPAAPRSGAGKSRAGATLDFLRRDPDFTDLKGMPGVEVDLKYAGRDNFTGRDVYGDFRRAFLRRTAARKLKRAAALLRRRHPRWKIVVFDALRPAWAQPVLWSHVSGARRKYVANPRLGSTHSFGMAVDAGLLDADGRPVDMGTGFDAFTPLSQPRLEGYYLRRRKLTETQAANRAILRDVMTRAGFTQFPLEWWHFDALPQKEVRRRTKIVD